uniref:Salivary lipocalin n=1 Tax=Triatoma matogrossensis TaxID=162370 RepID=E2J702_9HEMI
MKTIIAVTIFGILTYAFAEKLKYGENVCQDVDGLVNLDLKKFFKGTWYLTHSTPSARVTGSTICRDYEPEVKENGTVVVSYGYYENGADGNYYDIKCYGNQNKTRIDIFNFDCYSTNTRGEDNVLHVNASFVATDYDNFGVIYRCVESRTHFEDNVFIIFRRPDPSDGEVKKIAKFYKLKLNKLISRKGVTCKTKKH